jgi:hypothetical protein
VERARDLAHHHPRRIATICEVISRGSQNVNSPVDQSEDAQFLGHQLAGKAAGVFHDDRFNIVTFDSIEQGAEAFPSFDRIGT